MSDGRKVFKIEAEGDEIYVRAANESAAKMVMTMHFGGIPDELLTLTEILSALPPGTEVLE